MQLMFNDYAAFKLMFVGLGSGPVFYHDGGGSDFQITAFTLNGTALRVTSIGNKPGSFDTDFPAAVAMPADPAFN